MSIVIRAIRVPQSSIVIRAIRVPQSSIVIRDPRPVTIQKSAIPHILVG
jgi:hypothetical protein